MTSTTRTDRSRSTPAKLRAPARRVSSDPPMRADRTCVYVECGGELSKVAVANEDPFCSTVCCRRHYGVLR